MSMPDPTVPPETPPPTLGESKSVMNPQLISNVTVLGAYGLIALALIGATVLAAIHDGGYTQQAFNLYMVVAATLGIGSPVTAAFHTFVKRNSA